MRILNDIAKTGLDEGNLYIPPAVAAFKVPTVIQRFIEMHKEHIPVSYNKAAASNYTYADVKECLKSIEDYAENVVNVCISYTQALTEIQHNLVQHRPQLAGNYVLHSKNQRQQQPLTHLEME